MVGFSGQTELKPGASSQEKNMSEPYVWIAILITGGGILLYWRGYRQFKRRNANGVEPVRSYATTFVAEIGNTLLFWVGYAALVAGLVMLVIYDQSLLSWVALAVLLGLSLSWNREKGE